MNELTKKTIFGLVQFMICMGILLFAPVWTFKFWHAWVYLLLFGASTMLITAYLWKKDPKLLARRVSAGPGAEKEKSQKRIQLVASAAFIGVFILCSLDRRFLWSHVPLSIVIWGDVFVVLGFLIIFIVFKENTFTAATIEVAADQQVISSGPYAIVRHPMYAGALIMLFGTPPALGSWWGLVLVVLMTSAIVWRLLDEEKFLTKNLPGYEEYKKEVHYRLVPLIW